MFVIGLSYVVFEFLQLLGDDLANLFYLRLQLSQSWIIVYVLLHLLVLADLQSLQTSQSPTPQPQRILSRLSPLHMRGIVLFVSYTTILAHQLKIVTGRRRADGINRGLVVLAENLLLHSIYYIRIQSQTIQILTNQHTTPIIRQLFVFRQCPLLSSFASRSLFSASSFVSSIPSTDSQHLYIGQAITVLV